MLAGIDLFALNWRCAANGLSMIFIASIGILLLLMLRLDINFKCHLHDFICHTIEELPVVVAPDVCGNFHVALRVFS